jgi:tagatose 1,6-diphosphate aldolase GatY/KbaY
MLVTTGSLLEDAASNGYAIGAFNVYNLEGAKAVFQAAESQRSPVILQLHPKALRYGGKALVTLCFAFAEQATIKASIHLDHCDDLTMIDFALAQGITSIMADGSGHADAANIQFTQKAADKIHRAGGFLEAELGRLTGSEDGLTVAQYNEKLTDPDQAADFVRRTNADALAVCIGNVHGTYRNEPKLDFERLQQIKKKLQVPIVMHGASGLPKETVARAIRFGTAKFNVNTELRTAFLGAVRSHDTDNDLLDFLEAAVARMQAVASDKIELFGSKGKC